MLTFPRSFTRLGTYRQYRSAYPKKKVSKKAVAGRRYATKKRKTAEDKFVTLRMLRQLVPRPELKHHDSTNGATFSNASNYAAVVKWTTAFEIIQGVGRTQRVGEEICIRKVECRFELIAPAAPANLDLLTDSQGFAGTANVIPVPQKDQAVRLQLIDCDMDVASGVTTDSFYFLGSTNGNAPGGASSYFQDPDLQKYADEKRQVHLDKVYTHYEAPAGMNRSVANSTTIGPMGIPICRQQSHHSFVLDYGPKGRKFRYNSNLTQVPIHMPVLIAVGKNAITGDNPLMRIESVRVWFTDS